VAQDGHGRAGGLCGPAALEPGQLAGAAPAHLIVDEAHNTKTDKSFTALQRLNPSFILELTATPIAAKTNVLYHVSAQELAAET
jgi:type III restriction enzyme